MPRLTPFLNFTDGAGRFHSLPLPEDQRAIDAAVLAVADAGFAPVVRFIDDAGRCRHVARYDARPSRAPA